MDFVLYVGGGLCVYGCFNLVRYFCVLLSVGVFVWFCLENLSGDFLWLLVVFFVVGLRRV